MLSIQSSSLAALQISISLTSFPAERLDLEEDDDVEDEYEEVDADVVSLTTVVFAQHLQVPGIFTTANAIFCAG